MGSNESALLVNRTKPQMKSLLYRDGPPKRAIPKTDNLTKKELAIIARGFDLMLPSFEIDRPGFTSLLIGDLTNALHWYKIGCASRSYPAHANIRDDWHKITTCCKAIMTEFGVVEQSTIIDINPTRRADLLDLINRENKTEYVDTVMNALNNIIELHKLSTRIGNYNSSKVKKTLGRAKATSAEEILYLTLRGIYQVFYPRKRAGQTLEGFIHGVLKVCEHRKYLEHVPEVGSVGLQVVRYSKARTAMLKGNS